MLAKHERWCISVFIVISTGIFVWIGKPRQLLIAAGAINGLILPIALSIVLIAATKTSLMKGYKHPVWMQVAGWMVVIAMGWLGFRAIAGTIHNL